MSFAPYPVPVLESRECSNMRHDVRGWVGRYRENQNTGNIRRYVLATCRWRGLSLSLGALDVAIVWKTLSFGEVLTFPICSCLGTE